MRAMSRDERAFGTAGVYSLKPENWRGATKVQGADLVAVVERTARLIGVETKLPKLQVHMSISQKQQHSTGRCWKVWRNGQPRIYVTIGLNVDFTTIVEMMLHETCHLVGSGHDMVFKQAVVKAAKAIMGVDASDALGVPRMYGLDDVIRVRHRKLIGAPYQRPGWVGEEWTKVEPY